MPITSQTLSRYLNSVFVETGTFLGDGTAAALQAGFPRVHTIEAYPDLYHGAVARFVDVPQVTCHLGSSVERLQEIVASLTEPATFWLDAHTCGGGTAGAWECSLIGELRIIAHFSPIKTHVILIDDLYMCGLELPFMPEILSRLAVINPAYNIAFIESAALDKGNDILAATP